MSVAARTEAPRIGLIHATPVAIDPVLAAFAEAWPEALPCSLLEDSLSPDRARDKELTPEMTERIGALSRYVWQQQGSAGILFTCSAFGPAIEAAATVAPVPVLKPNEAMFEAALGIGGRLALIATFEPSVASMAEEFEAMRKRAGIEAELVSLVVPEAMDCLRAGDAEGHNRLVAACADALTDCTAVMLAHFSTSQARAAVEAVVEVPVLTAPHAAVNALKARLG